MISLGPDLCRRLDEALAREWLVANGLGGYAAASLAGTPTRRYHGLLVTADRPPAARRVLLSHCEEMLTYGGQPYLISTTEYADGTLAPAGYIHIAGFRLERGLPTTTYEIGRAGLEKTVWMAYGRQTTYVRYRLSADADGPAELRLRPLISGRPLHELARGGPERTPDVLTLADGCLIERADLPAGLRLHLTGGRFELAPDWHWHLLYRRERERGLDFSEDLFTPGTLSTLLRPGGEATLIVTAEPPERPEADPAIAWRLEWRRRGELLQRADLPPGDELGRALTLAADACLVGRADPAAPEGRAIVAGYPWLGERGRDSLIALPGLTLATGRPAEARSLLVDLLGHCRDGLLPARFDEASGLPAYGPVDVGLWLFVALRAYLSHSGDAALLRQHWPTLLAVLDALDDGRHGVRADPADGLLAVVDPPASGGVTWAGDHDAPRRPGKPLALNALWHNALRQAAEWAAAAAPGTAERLALAAERVEAGVNRRFWYAPGGYLYAAVDGEGGPDPAMRPEQVLAIGLPFAVLARDRWRPVLDAVTDHLLTPYGLRTLSPSDANYRGWYAGDVTHRERAYARGTIWPWLLGAYGDAHRRVYGDRAGLRDRLQLARVFTAHLAVAGLGYISELFDGEAPHSPQGCIAQATSIGEVLRLWRALTPPEAERE